MDAWRPYLDTNTNISYQIRVRSITKWSQYKANMGTLSS